MTVLTLRQQISPRRSTTEFGAHFCRQVSLRAKNSTSNASHFERTGEVAARYEQRYANCVDHILNRAVY